MTFSSSTRRRLMAAVLTILGIGFAALPSSAQQITYYDFNTPQNSGQFSYTCSNTVSSSNPLFCFNDATGNQANPSFVSTPYPASIDPSGGNGGNYDAAQMTPATPHQSSSMWFSVPQKVTNGFTAYFAFQLTGGTRADGIAFVLQNAQGNGRDSITNCAEMNSGGLTAVATTAQGGCIGYGGIDNSVALEFDTFGNGWDPNNNHIALQSCGLSPSSGTGLPNSPSHDNTSGGLGCTVQLTNPTETWAYGTAGQGWAISSPPTGSLDLASGIHQVVMIYNGPNDFPANTLTVYIDPPFNPGTHTPAPTAVPVFQGGFNLQNYIVPYNSGTASSPTPDSAFVGFTAGTGESDEIQDIMAWTFTPHTTVSQVQPLNQPTATEPATTTYNFGTHSYSVTYPAGSQTQTSGITMGVIANTISPRNFSNLLGVQNGAGQYTGSACQIYDDTGGNCIIYSVYCYNGSPGNVVACPPSQPTLPTDCANPAATDCIDLTSSYNNSVEPVSPGYLKGDPLYSPITSIVGNGSVATVTCTGECAVTANQIVTILDAQDNAEFTNVTVNSTGLTPNTFTFNNTFNGTDNGGFITSNNVQDIFQSYTSGNNDGSSTGKIPAYSDFVVTGTTVVGTQTQISAPNNNNATQGEPEELTATVSAPGVTGLTLLSAQGIGNPAPLPGSNIGGSVSFSDNGGAVTSCQNVPLTATTSTVNNVTTTTYTAQCNYQPPATGTDTITVQYSGDAYHQPSSGEVALNVSPQTVQVTVETSPVGLTYDVVGPTALTSGIYSGLQTLSFNVGTSYRLFAPSPQPAATSGTQYVFNSWSDGVNSTTSPTDVVSPTAATTYTASFTTQYLLSATAGTGGTVNVPGGYYNAGSVEPIVATPNSGYAFSSWTGAGVANPSSASTTITMNAPETITANFSAVPVASVTPPSIDFGDALYLGDIVTKFVTISNTGAAPMTISDPFIAILPGVNGKLSEFVTLNLCPKTLAAGKTCYMTVTFIAGPFYKPQSATLTVNTNAPGPVTVPLTATVINPQAHLSASSVSFGTVKAGSSSTKSITLTNTGGTTLSSISVSVTGDTADFSASGCPSSLSAGASCAIGITFSPGAKATDAAALVITDNAKNSPQTVTLSGKGN